MKFHFYGEKQVRKTVDDIRKAIGIVKYGLKEYQEVVDEVADFDVNDLDKYKRNLLQLAIDLMQRKINVNNQDDKGRTALHYLCAKPINVELVEGVLKAGGDPNLQSKEMLSPLYEIVSRPNNMYANERCQIIELLLDYGGDKTLPCRNGRTAEAVAKEIGDRKTIEMDETQEEHEKVSHKCCKVYGKDSTRTVGELDMYSDLYLNDMKRRGEL